MCSSVDRPHESVQIVTLRIREESTELSSRLQHCSPIRKTRGSILDRTICMLSPKVRLFTGPATASDERTNILFHFLFWFPRGQGHRNIGYLRGFSKL